MCIFFDHDTVYITLDIKRLQTRESGAAEDYEILLRNGTERLSRFYARELNPTIPRMPFIYDYYELKYQKCAFFCTYRRYNVNKANETRKAAGWSASQPPQQRGEKANLATPYFAKYKFSEMKGSQQRGNSPCTTISSKFL